MACIYSLPEPITLPMHLLKEMSFYVNVQNNIPNNIKILLELDVFLS